MARFIAPLLLGFALATQANAAVFLSLKASEVNLRVGPGLEYPVRIQLRQKHLPVRLLDRFGEWRKIRTATAQEGWAHIALLSSQNYVLVRARTTEPHPPNKLPTIRLYTAPRTDSRIIALLQEGVQARLTKCKNQWCALQKGALTGWAHKRHLWGAGE